MITSLVMRELVICQFYCMCAMFYGLFSLPVDIIGWLGTATVVLL